MALLEYQKEQKKISVYHGATKKNGTLRMFFLYFRKRIVDYTNNSRVLFLTNTVNTQFYDIGRKNFISS